MGMSDFLACLFYGPKPLPAKAQQPPPLKMVVSAAEIRHYAHARAIRLAGCPYSRPGMPKPPRYTTN